MPEKATPLVMAPSAAPAAECASETPSAAPAPAAPQPAQPIGGVQRLGQLVGGVQLRGEGEAQDGTHQADIAEASRIARKDHLPPRVPKTLPTLDKDHLPPEVRKMLTTLDDRLVKVLESEDIRLVRTTWLLAQPPEFRMAPRQELELSLIHI